MPDSIMGCGRKIGDFRCCSVVQGDSEVLCLDLLGGEVDAVISDPPYGMDNDTDYTRFSGGHHDSIAKRGIGRDYGVPIHGDDKPFNPSPWLRFERVILWGANHFGQSLPRGTTLIWLKRNDDALGSFLSDAEIAWMKGGMGVYCRRDLSMNAITRDRRQELLFFRLLCCVASYIRAIWPRPSPMDKRRLQASLQAMEGNSPRDGQACRE